MRRLAIVPSPLALNDSPRAWIALRRTTMPSAVFCVSNWPMSDCSGVWPIRSLPALRMALSTSMCSKVAGAMEKWVLVCSERASSATLLPVADSTVRPEALPRTAELRLKAAIALATSMLRGSSWPDSCSLPSPCSLRVTCPCAVPPPSNTCTCQRSASPSRTSVKCVRGCTPGRTTSAWRGRQPASNKALPSNSSRWPWRVIQVRLRNRSCSTGKLLASPGGDGVTRRLRSDSCGNTPPSISTCSKPSFRCSRSANRGCATSRWKVIGCGCSVARSSITSAGGSNCHCRLPTDTLTPSLASACAPRRAASSWLLGTSRAKANPRTAASAAKPNPAHNVQRAPRRMMRKLSGPALASV